jgi:hypothetical protein
MDEAVFVIRNQQGHYWTRAKDWVDGREPQRVMKLKHRDEVVNQLVELSAKNIDLRGEIVSCSLTDRGGPKLEVSTVPTPTLAEKAVAQKAAAAEAALAAEPLAHTDGEEEPDAAHAV